MIFSIFLGCYYSGLIPDLFFTVLILSVLGAVFRLNLASPDLVGPVLHSSCLKESRILKIIFSLLLMIGIVFLS